MLALVAAACAGFSLPLTCIAVLAAFYLPECALASAKGWYLSPRMIAAMVVRDMILPVMWARGWLGGAVGARSSVLCGGVVSLLAGVAAIALIRSRPALQAEYAAAIDAQARTTTASS